MTVLTIDFEASCLPKHGRSFPIEVGIADGDTARSWLIRPDRDWWGWDWTAEAEALHGLPRERIDQEGWPVDAVLEELERTVRGRRVVADSRIDQYWLETLAAAARRPVPFAIDHVADILDETRASEAVITRAVAAANAAHPIRHRAASDALWLSTVIGSVRHAAMVTAE